MKKRLLLGVFLLLVAAALFAQSGPSLTVVNRCGYPIYYIFISTADTDDWEEDVLGENVLMPGQSVLVRLPSNGTWDFMAVDGDGDTYTVYGVRVPGTDGINIQ